MDYQKFAPNADFASLIKYYWTLSVPKSNNPSRQRIVPEGSIEMIFNTGDDVKRRIAENEYIIQPRAMIIGQITEPFYILPTGKVETFGVSFYPYGFANFVSNPIVELANCETPLRSLFDKDAIDTLEAGIINSKEATAKIQCVEVFLSNKLCETNTIDKIVKSTIDTIFTSKGQTSISEILNKDQSKKRQLERNFKKQVGISPKQLSKVIRLQAALEMMLNQHTNNLTNIAYESGYYDQSHFIKDFKKFTGINPNEFLNSEEMELSTLFYTKS